MTRMTITEALADIKNIPKRIAKKEEGARQYLARQEIVKDPLQGEGGSEEFIRRERQAISDLRERIVRLRRAIRRASEVTEITVGGQTRTMADWLAWRREAAAGHGEFLASLRKGINGVRQTAQQKNMGVRESFEGGLKPTDILINISEKELAEQIDLHEEIMGVLDGQLSLKDATTFVEVDN